MLDHYLSVKCCTDNTSDNGASVHHGDNKHGYATYYYGVANYYSSCNDYNSSSTYNNHQAMQMA
jgi:hypothetical protein